jgi:hypothetical protein
MAGLTREERQRREQEAQQIQQRERQEAERRREDQSGSQDQPKGLQKAHQEREAAQIDEGGDDGAARARQEAKLNQEFGGVAYVNIDEQHERLNEIDERLEDRRPGTLRDRETGEAFEDNRKFAGDLGKAANQMIGRTFITENADIHPHITNPYANAGGVAYPNPQDPNSQGDGEEVVILKGYQPYPEKEGGPLPEKLQAGMVTRLPMKEAKRLLNMGVAKFTEENNA